MCPRFNHLRNRATTFFSMTIRAQPAAKIFFGFTKPMFPLGFMNTQGGYPAIRIETLVWLHHPWTKNVRVVNQADTYALFCVQTSTLWLFNIAMEAMAHRNRWFTCQKWWIFPWQTVSHNQRVILDLFRHAKPDHRWNQHGPQIWIQFLFAFWILGPRYPLVN